MLCAGVLLGVAAQAQTARKLTVNLTPDGAANIQVFLPESPTGRAIVGCPGGGYSHLSMQNEGTDWAEYFNRQGIAYCVLTYRMPKGDRSLPMSDAQNAIRTVRDSAEAWRVNPYDVGIMGFSAGGHLASTTATHAPIEARPDFQILFYPVISMDERVTHKGSVVNFLGDGRRDDRLVKEFSNDRRVRRHQTPPAFIVMAGDDVAEAVVDLRKVNNFGLLRNPDTLEWLGPAPIYESGSCLGYDKLTPQIRSGAGVTCKPFKRTHQDQLRLVTSFDWLDLSKLNGVDQDIRKVFAGAEEFIDKERVEAIIASVNQRIQMLETFVLTQQPQENSTENDVERNVAAEYGMNQQL